MNDRGAATLRDAELERRYRDDGFVVMPMLGPEEVAALQDAYWDHIAQPGDHGLTVDYLRPDRRVMATIAELLAPVWARHLHDVFVDHRPIFTTFVVKHPDERSNMFLHEDRSWVDERRYRSGTLWIPLTDVGPELDNGGLQIIRHSHLLADGWSGTGTPDLYAPFEDRLRASLETPTVPAGSAVYYDSRTLHASPPNRSCRPRVAIACGIAPRSADLIHVVGDGDHRRIYAVDEEFFVRNSPRDLVGGMPPGYPVVEEHEEHPTLSLDRIDATIGPAAQAPATIAAAPLGEDASTHPLPTVTKLRDEYELRLTGTHRRRALAPALAATVSWNNRAVRAAAPLPNPVPLEGIEWAERLARSHAGIRAEWDAFAGSGLRLPLLEDVFGGPQGNVGSWWRGLPLVLRGQAVGPARRHFRATVAALNEVPGLHSAMWSVMGPGGSLPPHCGPNAGALRLLIGVAGSDEAVVTVGDTEVALRDGQSVLFDDTDLHSSTNRGSTPRVLILCDIIRPVRGPVRWTNRVVQELHHELIPRFRDAPAIGTEWFEAINPGAG